MSRTAGPPVSWASASKVDLPGCHSTRRAGPGRSPSGMGVGGAAAPSQGCPTATPSSAQIPRPHRRRRRRRVALELAIAREWQLPPRECCCSRVAARSLACPEGTRSPPNSNPFAPVQSLAPTLSTAITRALTQAHTLGPQIPPPQPPTPLCASCDLTTRSPPRPSDGLISDSRLVAGQILDTAGSWPPCRGRSGDDRRTGHCRRPPRRQ
jgi:hypothetical protein